MTRRTSPKAKADDAAFPVRVKVLVPELGFGKASNAMHDWLRVNLGLESYAVYPTGSRLPQQSAFYFVDLEAANGFFAEFPELELADGRVAGCTQRGA